MDEYKIYKFIKIMMNQKCSKSLNIDLNEKIYFGSPLA